MRTVSGGAHAGIALGAMLLAAAPALGFGEVLDVVYKGTRVCVGADRVKVEFPGTLQIASVGDQFPVTVEDEIDPYPEAPRANWEPLSDKQAGFGFGGFDIPLADPAGTAERIDVWVGTASLHNGTEIKKVTGQRTILSFQAGASCQAVLKFKGKPGSPPGLLRAAGGAAARSSGAPGGR